VSTTGIAPVGRARRWWWAAIVIASLATLVTGVLLGLGALSLPGLALVAFGGFAGVVVLLWFAPQALIVIAPALIHLPLAWIVFPYELVLGAFAALVLLYVLATRPPWAFRLAPVEIAYGVFMAWALFTGLWLIEVPTYVLGVRRLLEGATTLWLGYRLARMAPRSWFEAGVLAGAISLTTATVMRRMSHGLTEKQLLFNRASATDLGWGTSNFVATLLLLFSPILIEVAFKASQRWMRAASVATVCAIAILQFQIASRAATVLFVLAVLVQLGWSHARRAWWALLVAIAALAALTASPIGEGVLARFSNVRDLGSMVIRLWYFREAWRRTVDHFPWGIGLTQGPVYPDKLQDIDPHNYWLVVSSELGLVGLVLWVVVLVLIHRSLVRILRTPGWETMGRALLVVFWAGQIHSLVEPTFQGVQYEFVYFWLFGGYLGYHAYALERAPRGPIASTSR